MESGWFVPCLVIAFTLAIIEASAFFDGHTARERCEQANWTGSPSWA